ncbi:Ig-like domain-containing protein, partial [Pseudovibrio sp. Alg231-02]|uniref:Ig-like domain-containing protein n=1 Tax=Pseudovibrio sp. Alg231-02 TaxID=1922223 RepID=UPI0018FF2557
MSNSAPFSYPIQISTTENDVISIRVFFQDFDLVDTHTLALNVAEMIGTGTVISDDTFHYDPGTKFDHLAVGETATDTFSYTITDAAGESATSTVTITVTGQNEGPVAVEIARQTDENTAINIAPEFVDFDTSDTHSIAVDTSDTTGSVTVNADGTFTYSPDGKYDALNRGETATDTFTYTVTDASGESSTETVTVTILGEGNVTAKSGKLVASDGAEYDSFGHGVQMNDHGVVVVGASGDDDKGSESGSVYVYTPDGGSYAETKLVASDGADLNHFGANTAINNSGVVAVSAFGDGTPGSAEKAIYVFTPTDGGSYSEVKLTVPEGIFSGMPSEHGLSMNASGVIVASVFDGIEDKIYIFTPDGIGGYAEDTLFIPGAGSASGNVSINDGGVIFADGPGDLARVFTPDPAGIYIELELSAPDTNDS